MKNWPRGGPVWPGLVFLLKSEPWPFFCVCVCVSCRSDHLYAFFVQWTPDVYGEGLGGLTREPGFVVVKKNQDAESGEHGKPIPDITFKDWEV